MHLGDRSITREIAIIALRHGDCNEKLSLYTLHLGDSNFLTIRLITPGQMDLETPGRLQRYTLEIQK